MGGVEIRSALPIPPYVPAEDIAIDVGRIARVARIGHLSGIDIRANYQQDEIQIGVAETHEDGSASASSTGVASKADRVDAQVPQSGNPQNSKAKGNLTINFGHSDFDDANLRDPKLWAKYMDQSLRRGMKDAAHKKLTGNKLQRIMNGGIDLSTNYLLNVSLLGMPPSRFLFWYGIYTNSIFPMAGKIINKRPENVRDFEFSLLAGISMPYDRVALASLYANTRRFAKVNKPE